ncbi:hypothetical protein TrST_g6049 [Triparma strigata]|uniref:GST N-terminal domain-containing protein n=1 Tax=Triparma strigata TaxID=1606541 RepID=A0A9W7AZ53_9STRA|nr:hypothetical protein TrST_g6049 [Triparma strigata]
MFTLYHCTGSRSVRVLWTLHELNLLLSASSAIRYNLVNLPFPPRSTSDYVSEVNPLGTVPFLSLPDGSGMTESCAAPLYLAGSHPTSPSLTITPSSPCYPSFLNWNFHADATLTFPLALHLRYNKFEPARNLGEVGDDYVTWYFARLRLVNKALEDGREFLCENKFSVADINVGYALMLGKSLGLGEGFKPQVQDYLQRLEGREGLIAAIKESEEADRREGIKSNPF